METNRIQNAIVVIILLITTTFQAQTSNDHTGYKSIIDFGARMDGTTDDSGAIERSLKELNYAYIPVSENGARINKTIIIKENQNIFGLTRSSKIVSHVPSGDYAIRAEYVTPAAAVHIKDLTVDVRTKGSNGIQAFETRNVYIDNVAVLGNKLAGVGIQLDGGKEYGSAWNQVTRYTVIRCNIGIELTSQTMVNFCNRNFVGFGVVQSCQIGVRLYKASTNVVKACPQGSPRGYVLESAKYNTIETFIENSGTNSMDIDEKSTFNTISGAFKIQNYLDKGRGNRLLVGSPKDQPANLD